MATKKSLAIDWESLLSGIPEVRTLGYGASRKIYREGDAADSVFLLRHGKVKLSVTSKQGKEAIIAILDNSDFFGEGCLAGQPFRMATATALTDCSLSRLEKTLMVRLLHEKHEISEMFVTHLLSRNIRFEADLVDQLFNSSEKRLARILLLLSHFGKESKLNRCFPGSARRNWPKWWARRVRGSVIS